MNGIIVYSVCIATLGWQTDFSPRDLVPASPCHVELDFRTHNLHQLLRHHGPASKLAHRVFRWMMGTIEYHPGGREPRRILCFRPHPDDDVISMGGTMLRLAEDRHELHLAYMTNGNIAVRDNDVQQLADLLTARIASARGPFSRQSSDFKTPARNSRYSFIAVPGRVPPSVAKGHGPVSRPRRLPRVWQRAEDRNRHTADLFDQIGRPEYYAMEAFVRWDGRES